MTVAELEQILATLPDDAVVTIQGQHVEYLSRSFRERRPVLAGYDDCGHPGHPRIPRYETLDVPPRVELGTTIHRTPFHGPAPELRLHGRWPRAAKALVEEFNR